MPDYGKYILNDLEFNNTIQEMDDRGVIEFTAKLAYSNSIRICSLEDANRKRMGIIATVGTFVGAVIVGVIEYFRK